ncbi:MAG: DUF4258 domain-containing protein [Bradymonadia bacterium]
MKKKPKLEHVALVLRVREALASGKYRILPHARQRCTERDVAAPDIENALMIGRHVPRRDRYDEPHQSWSYCFDGASVDGDALRVVVSFDDWMLIITVVRLGEED